MSDVLIQLGGAGGKNRGNSFYISDTAPTAEIFGRIFTPLPAGVYKKFVTPDGQVVFPSADGGDAVVSMSKEFLKKQAIKTFGIASITNFSLALYAHKQVRLTWAKPTRGLWSGVHFVFKYDSMPTSTGDGFTAYDSADVHYETPVLQERQLYVRAYNYVTTNEGRWYDEGTVSATIRVSGISGSVTLGAGAGTWTVPEGVRRIRYILVGRGGMGAASYRVSSAGGGGGGYVVQGYMEVYPGQSLPWIVPAGAIPASTGTRLYNNTANIPSLNTVLGGISAQHGKDAYSPAKYDRDSSGGNGGSGGGGPYTNGGWFGGTGGSNGSDGVRVAQDAGGYPSSYSSSGIGQHTTTTGFNGVLYAGGGGGGKANGGSGGGGNGWSSNPNDETRIQVGRNGVDGLGGGGGGGARGGGAGLGGTGCIYIAWGSLMNDGS